MAVRRIIYEKYKHIDWSPYVVYCFNLIYKDIDKLDHVVKPIRHALKVKKFMYNHVTLLSWLKKNDG